MEKLEFDHYVSYLVILLLKLGGNFLSLFIGTRAEYRHDGFLVTACSESSERKRGSGVHTNP